MKVILISGKARHGKTTVADMMKEALEESGYKVLIANYGDAVKDVCKHYFGWDGKKSEYGRYIMQHVGTDIVRKQDETYWARFVRDMVKFFDGEWDYVIVADCRFPNELDVWQGTNLNTTHVRVVRTNFESPLTKEQQNHPSETALDYVNPDYLVMNDKDLATLQKRVYGVLAEIEHGHQITMEEWMATK